jgi:topoisomerase-4 subunit B
MKPPARPTPGTTRTGSQATTWPRAAGLCPDPRRPFRGQSWRGGSRAWAVTWLAEGGETITESYVNLIPTPRAAPMSTVSVGLLAAMREFCEFRNLIPRGLKLTGDDIWDRCCYVLSTKMTDPQFSGQTKERLSSRQCASFVTGAVKDAFSLWLNHQHRGGRAPGRDGHRKCPPAPQSRKEGGPQKGYRRPGPAWQAGRLHQPGPGPTANCFWWRGTRPADRPKQARDRQTQAVMPLRGKILNTWEVDSGADTGIQGSPRHCRGHWRGPGFGKYQRAALWQNLYPGGCRLRRPAHRHPALRPVSAALHPLVKAGHIFVAMPPLYRIDIGKKVFYALDEAEKSAIIRRMETQKPNGKINVQRFKGWVK